MGSGNLIRVLETVRLRLRPFEESDLELYAAGIFGDPEVMRYLPKNETPARERAARTLRVFNVHWTEHGYGPRAVTLRATGELVGHCGLRLIPELGETEVLYAFARSSWGKGYATEAAGACVEEGFGALGLRRIIALAVPENTASRRVMEHCGLAYERDLHIFGLDCVYYARNQVPSTTL